MPRKQRQPKTRITELSPAFRHVLMLGEHATKRVHGWVALEQIPDLPAACAAAWREHGEALTAEAAAAGFVPARGIRRRRPTGAAVERWRAAFLAQHTY
jgi:hypothetical protein